MTWKPSDSPADCEMKLAIKCAKTMSGKEFENGSLQAMQQVRFPLGKEFAGHLQSPVL